MTALPLAPALDDCWNRIGIRGDRSCPELAVAGHCHNCRVFAAAGRRFLDAPCPPGYLEEWTERLVAPVAEVATDLLSLLTFRLGDEWLALRVTVLVEVTAVRPIHRVPYRGGLLEGLVNIRGELHLCMRLADLVGGAATENGIPPSRAPSARFVVVCHQRETWVLPVDEIGQVQRFPVGALGPVPATVARAGSALTCGVVSWEGRPVGVLDEERLFEALRTHIR